MSDASVEKNVLYMCKALDLARQSPPKPSNFRVGALVVDVATDTVLATGYTLELPGNTHAEQCCFQKLAEQYGVNEDELALLPEAKLPRQLALYTTMEPCSVRLSGNLPCVQRILRLVAAESSVTRRVTVYSGIMEPGTFVSENTGRQILEAAGIQFVHVPSLEEEILAVATAGHAVQEEAQEDK
ncbi:hypothetical protein SEPCBS119000_001217 [Sporothrix epigloea]|uniref:CMP/dCMP-type deaminase domain-containing protein n=1 Tax=Sporothrix epigloea TaxID=1892477 RepID=A0ABP0DCM9_9PEZI